MLKNEIQYEKKSSFGKNRSQIRKTPQQDSENAPENVRPHLSRLLFSSSVVSGFRWRERIQYHKNTHSENTGVRFGKRLSQIRKTPLKTYDHICLACYSLLLSFPAFAGAEKIQYYKNPHSANTVSQIRKTPQPDSENTSEDVRPRLFRRLGSASFVSEKRNSILEKARLRKTPQLDLENAPENIRSRLSRLLGLLGSSSFVSGFCQCEKNIRKSSHSENTAARFGKPAARFEKRTENARLLPSRLLTLCVLSFRILPGGINFLFAFEH